MAEKKRVCVTGAGGYVASWLVKLLLSCGYTVHGTVRDPCDDKNAHLKKLDKASESLILFKTDLLDYQGLCSAIAGCSGVFHVACPVPPLGALVPEAEVIEPAVTGTRNVLNACLETKVKKVVVVSSIAAVILNPKWPKDQSMDEQCWSDVDFCRFLEAYYCLGKTIAEKEALEYDKRSELDIVTVCPSIVIGPMLQSSINSSSLLLLTLLKDGKESVEDNNLHLVDVRDVAEALLLVYENLEAKGRYICTSCSIRMRALVEKLKSMYPNYNFPTSFTVRNENLYEEHDKLSSEKLQSLGWKHKPLEETIVDSVNNYEETGALLKH